MNKRRHKRVRLHGHIAEIANGTFVYGGIIENISLEGLRLNNLPQEFSNREKTYYIVLSGTSPENHCKLTVRPCWDRASGSALAVDVGFNIVEAPLGWRDLVDRMIHKPTDGDTN